MSNSYRTLIERLRQFADGHYIIQKFYHGQIDAADLDKEPRYPMMHVLPVDIRASEGTLDYALEIRFADIGRDKEIKTDYQKEIISDMSRIALSLISEIENGEILFGSDAEIVDKQATIIPFIEEFTHVLTGVQLNVTIRLPFNWSACDIPADYSPNITDNPTTGSGILTKIGIYNDGDFVGYTSFVDFSDDFNVTVNGNKIEVTLVGGGGGAGTLQETTDLGNTTTNDIQLIDAAEVIFGAGGGVLLDNSSRLREGTIDANTGGSKGIAQICGVGYELKWEAGSQYVMNGSGDNIRIVNHKFNIAPVVTDDSSSGFYVGSKWILDNGDIYVCTDSTIGAAVWEIETYADWNAASGSREIANKPTIPTLTSDLTNDGEDGVNPFITALDIPSLTGYVPYTGATTDVDLGTHNLTADHISLNVNPSGAGYVVGATEWNNTIGSSQTLLKGGNVTLKNGVDLVARIVNKVTPNTTLTKANYQAVRVSGATGGRLSVKLAQANNDANSADTIGLVCETIATNQEGFIITVGQLLDINTTGSLQGETWADGDVLYLSPTTAGRITKVKPTGTGHIVVIGYVEYAHANNGSIYVKVMNGWELDELHDVSVPSPSDNQVLYYSSSELVWKAKTLAKGDVGLGNVDNTSDANKPISTATQTALDLKKNKAEQRIFETTSNQTTSSTTRADVTELTVPLLAGKKYRIELYGSMQSAAVTTGCSIGFYLSSGTATINGIIRGLVSTTASANAIDAFISIVTTTAGATGSFFTTSGVGAINTPHGLGGSFYIESDSNCDFKVQFGSEVAASTTLLAGSALIVDQLN
jgi:nitrogen fixation protein